MTSERQAHILQSVHSHHIIIFALLVFVALELASLSVRFDKAFPDMKPKLSRISAEMEAAERAAKLRNPLLGEINRFSAATLKCATKEELDKEKTKFFRNLDEIVSENSTLATQQASETPPPT
jgi:hypothetical protein